MTQGQLRTLDFGRDLWSVRDDLPFRRTDIAGQRSFPGRARQRKRIIRLMQEDGLKARARRRFKRTTMSDHDQPVAANLLDRRFDAPAPNQRWVGDTTEFVIGTSGKVYLAAILDL